MGFFLKLLADKVQSAETRVLKYLHNFSSNVKRDIKKPELWIALVAYIIPVLLLIYILYINFLPPGYNKTYTVQIGSLSDTDTTKQIYIEPSRHLSDRMTDSTGDVYRDLNGIAIIGFNPSVVYRNSNVSVDLNGSNIFAIPLNMHFYPQSISWDYIWNFSTSTPSNLTGNAYYFDGCEYFDGNSDLQLSNSENLFETGPFSVYASWKPEDNGDDFQEIAGHYNWELLQDKNDVKFQVGRMNNSSGPQYSVSSLIKNSSNFFNKSHTALAIYSPATNLSGNGYIDLYVDNVWAGRTNLGNDIIWPDYNGNINLSFGKSSHGIAKYFKGCISSVDLINNKIDLTNNITLPSDISDPNVVGVYSFSTSTLKSVSIHVNEK